MSSTRTLLLFIVASSLGVSSVWSQNQGRPTEAIRMWVDATGRTVKARLVGVQGAAVVLQLEDNTNATVPLERFSAADQAYVKKWAGGTGAVPPSATPTGPLVWPESVAVDPKSIMIVNGEQDPKARKYVYSSGAFQFTSNAPLTTAVMKDIASDFELVRILFEKLPWGWVPRPEGGHPKFFAVLHERDIEFINAGGKDNSSGRYAEGIIYTKFSTLGLKKVGERYAHDAKRDHDGEMIILLARQMLGEMRDFAPPWSSLGFEKFMEEVAYRNGAFQLARPERGLKELIAQNASFDIVPDADAMIKFLHSTWAEDRGAEVVDIRRRNYFNGAMLFYYFGYLDGKGDGARLHAYYRAMAQEAMTWRAYTDARKAGNNSVPNPRPNKSYADSATELNRHVIDGRDDAALKADIIAKFKAIGIKM